jgi:folate-dependent phosphoribosylglycinamide formyltransferase PurN
MKIIVLSTDRKHHRYFINRVNKEFPLEAVFFEKSGLDRKGPLIKTIRNPEGLGKKLYRVIFSPYWQLPLWNVAEDLFERTHFFKDVPYDLPKEVPVKLVRNINDEKSVSEIEILGPDVIILFGVSRIKRSLMKIPKMGVLNIHRGIVPQYRGLNSDLWAIYFGDFENIGVTVHLVDENLDTGDVVFQKKIKLSATDKIYHLRYITTIMATELLLEALREMKKGTLRPMPQPKKGRYFSYMPYFFKFKTIYKFWRYTSNLKRK